MNDSDGVIARGGPPAEAGRNDSPRFEELVARYRTPLTAAALHLCGEREAAQDAVQETLLAACQGFPSLRDPSRASAWLFAILRRKAAASRRTRRAETSLPEDLPAPPEPDALVSAVVREQLARLSREDREVLAGHYLLGLSYQELAEAFGVREGTVRVRCYRAKERMRDLLQSAGVHDAGKR